VTKPLPVVLATGNAGKVREFARLLAPIFLIEMLPAGLSLPAETGQTFAANARLKAEAVFAALGGGIAVLADDSGLEVAALGGRPGVQSARYANEGASDSENVSKLLNELRGCVDRKARFVCSLCLILPSGAGVGENAHILEVRGFSKGRITSSPRGSLGFGYDPVFKPEGWDLTLAEADPADKDRISHRGAAARALVELIAGGAEGVPPGGLDEEPLTRGS